MDYKVDVQIMLKKGVHHLQPLDKRAPFQEGTEKVPLRYL